LFQHAEGAKIFRNKERQTEKADSIKETGIRETKENHRQVPRNLLIKRGVPKVENPPCKDTVNKIGK
jgi:hypothetical protein